MSLSINEEQILFKDELLFFHIYSIDPQWKATHSEFVEKNHSKIKMKKKI